jgi:hypothetical protein
VKEERRPILILQLYGVSKSHPKVKTMGAPTEDSCDNKEVAEETEPVTRNYQVEYMNQDDDPDDVNEDEGLFGFVESDAMKAQANQQLEDAIKLIPQDAKAAYLEALERAPKLVATESDPMRFLRFEKFNAWAAARRLVTYWSSRVAIFGGEKAFLPLDLTGKGALDEEDLTFLDSGCVVTLPDDSKNRSVICIDRSNKIHGADDMCIRPLFFLLSAASENEMSQKEGCIVLVVLNSPTGATFHAGNVHQATELVRKALPLRLKKSHLLCCPPKPGASKFTETFIPMALQKLGKFFSRDAGVHVTNTETELLEKLLPYGLAREGLPSSVGGTFAFDKYVVWLEQRGLVVKKKAAPSENSQWDQSAIIRQTLANYSAQVAETEARSSENRKRVGFDVREDDDRKMAALPSAGANTEFLGYEEEGLSAAEKNEILCDIYGSTDVPFTITKEIRNEGRARARLEEALDLIPDEDKSAYLEARERAPHLVELESDPRRYLRNDGMDPWAAAKHLVLYWEKRKEIFGDKAFLPMTLDGRGALSSKCIELIKCGFFAILPNDKKGRVVMMHNRLFLNERLVSHGAQERIRCGFYVFSVMAEREESQLNGFIGTAVYGDGDTSSNYSRDFVKSMVGLLECGAMPFKVKAVHFVYPAQKKTFLHNILSRTLNIVGSWDFMEKRTVVHCFEKEFDLMEDLEKYGFEKDGTPEFLGGKWKYEYFNQMLEERARCEKSLYGGEEDVESKPDSSEMSPEKRKLDGNDAAFKEKERRAKKRKMDALYARRKRERQRIEVEVLEDQCKELGEKNRSLDSDNKRLETILKEANGQVERYESSQSQSQSQAIQGTTQVPSTVGGGASQQSILEQLLQDPNLRSLLQQATNGNVARGSAPVTAPRPSHFASRYQAPFSHQPGMPASASTQYSSPTAASIAAPTHVQGALASGLQSLPSGSSSQYPQSIAASLVLQSLLQGSLMHGFQPQQDASGQLPSAPRAEAPAPANPAPTAASILELLALLRTASSANPHQS